MRDFGELQGKDFFFYFFSKPIDIGSDIAVSFAPAYAGYLPS
ncbi:hypothetical protein [Pseudobacteroides cellulosolvens]|nr:hypothetical protein [Pseudobacteroides cellulosolvens]